MSRQTKEYALLSPKAGSDSENRSSLQFGGLQRGGWRGLSESPGGSYERDLKKGEVLRAEAAVGSCLLQWLAKPSHKPFSQDSGF